MENCSTALGEPSIDLIHLKKMANEKIFVKQLSDWDCGIACLRMAQNIHRGKVVNIWRAIDRLSNEEICSYVANLNAAFHSDGDDCEPTCQRYLSQLLFPHPEEKDASDIVQSSPSLANLVASRTPLWTIDILWGLIEYGFDDVKMFSECLGVTSSHSDLGWYARTLPSDSSRISSQFALAKERGLSMFEQTLSIDALQQSIADGCIAIVLVDSNTLYLRPVEEDVYSGHFIVIIQISSLGNNFIYFDPAMTAVQLEVSASQLERAWSKRGTDRDAILIGGLCTP